MGKHTFKLILLLLVGCALVGSLSLLPTLLLIGLGHVLGARRAGKMLFHAANEAANYTAGGFFIYVAQLLVHMGGIAAEATAIVPGRTASPDPCRFCLSDILKPPPRGKISIVVSNHRTRLDWMLLWIIFARCEGVAYALKIVLKDELSRIPFFGWAMQYFRFIFLSRSWEVDKERMTRAVSYYKTFSDSTVLLIFPEGTDLHPAAIAKSNVFAAQHGKAGYTYVLHPRTTGMTALLDSIGDSLHEVIDITMGYEDYVEGERPNEKTFWKGRLTKKINVLVQKWRFEEPPKQQHRSPRTDYCFYWPDRSADGLAQWLDQQFQNKEARLREYYVDARPAAVRDMSWMTVAYKLKLAPEANCVATPEEAWIRLRPERPNASTSLLIPASWTVGTIVVVAAIVSSPKLLFLCALVVCFYVLETKLAGGIDQWLLFPAGGQEKTKS